LSLGKIILGVVIGGLILIGIVAFVGIMMVGSIFSPSSTEKTTDDYVLEAWNKDNPEICFESDNLGGCIAKYAFGKKDPQACLILNDIGQDSYNCIVQFIPKDPDEKYCDLVRENMFENCMYVVNDWKEP